MRWLTPCFILLVGCFVLTSVFSRSEAVDLWDPKSSNSKSGVSTPRDYFIPPAPPYERVDPKEFADYQKTHYSPYAQLQVPQALQIGDKVLKMGYYLVKLDILPPPLTNIATESTQKKRKWFWQREKMDYPILDASTSPQEERKVSLIIKQAGRVEVVIPVSGSQKAAQKIKKGSIAQLVSEPGNPLSPQVVYLQYCVEEICYQTSPLLPGLIQ